MLFRHVQPLFMSTEYTEHPVRGPNMRVRPLDTDAPDHLMRFVLWGAIQTRAVTPTRAAADVSKPKDPKDPGDAKEPEVIVVTAPARPKLLIEMSADGEGWVVVSTLDARERPYLVTVAHMLPFVRVRLESNGVPSRGYALVMGNAPFSLDGRSPIVGPPRPGNGKDPIIVTLTRR